MAFPAQQLEDRGAQQNWDMLAQLVFYGTGSPEGRITAKVGATYHRLDGGAGTSFYIKESGNGNTGWRAV